MLTIRLDSSVPLVDQVVRGIRTAIARGDVREGDDLPPVRQLAADLGINWNTVARAYRELEAQGLLVTARGRGTRVVATVESRPETAGEGDRRVSEAVRDALADARLRGLSVADVMRILRGEVDRMWRRGKEVATR